MEKIYIKSWLYDYFIMNFSHVVYFINVSFYAFWNKSYLTFLHFPLIKFFYLYRHMRTFKTTASKSYIWHMSAVFNCLIYMQPFCGVWWWWSFFGVHTTAVSAPNYSRHLNTCLEGSGCSLAGKMAVSSQYDSFF